MWNVIPEQIYNRIWTILDTDPDLSYFKTKQRGFFPRGGQVSQDQFPWLFMEDLGMSGIEGYRMPMNWQSDFTIAVVLMTYADAGDIESIVVGGGDNVNKGILQMQGDVANVLWKHHKGGIGVNGVIKWTIARSGTPSLLNIQRLLMSDFIRGRQIDIAFNISEVESIS